MKAASLKELKDELSGLPASRLQELCLQMAKYKKDNKEFLSYLLFDAWNEQSFVRETKEEIGKMFESVHRTNLYLAKKTIRKILAYTNKCSKYSGIKQTEVELLLCFCVNLRSLGLPLTENTALGNIYCRQIEKIKKTLPSFHEDFQHDIGIELDSLNA